MIKVLASAPRASLPPVSLPKDNSCLARIQAIWNAIYSFISEWACYLLCFTPCKERVANSFSQCGPDPLFKISQYLEPEDVASLERASFAVKAAIGERIWKGQYDQNGVSYMPQSGKHKDAFVYPYPEMAFGPREWLRFWGDPGEDLPRLPTAIHRTLAKKPAIKEKYVLTFCPATLDGRTFSLNCFRERLLAPREGIPVQFYDGLWPQIFKRYGEEAAGKAHWVFMEEKVWCKGITIWHMANDRMIFRMGRTLDVALSVVAALYYPKTRYFLGPHPGIGDIPDNWVFTRTSDALKVGEDGTGCVAVGGLQLVNFDPAKTHYSLSFLFVTDWYKGQQISNRDVGIADCFLVTQDGLPAL